MSTEQPTRTTPTKMVPRDLPSDFTSLPWCAALLSHPSTVLHRTLCREPKTHTTEDSLFSRTFRTPSTLRAYLTLQHGGETITLISIGSGVNGHADIVHGGVVATFLDEVLGAAVGVASFTAFLTVTYKRPVPTPGVIMGRARVTRREGRKWWVSATLEDGAGGVFAGAESLFVEQVQAKL